VATLSGEKGPGESVICLLLGSTVPFPPDRLATLYPSEDAYRTSFTTATDASIAAGFALEEDRDQILATADPDAIPR
jgi:hypothetical protein